MHARTQLGSLIPNETHPGVLPEGPGLWLGGPAWCTLCCSKLRHSPRQLRVAAEVAFRSSRSWSKAVRGPEPGRDSMACTRFFCCPSTWFIIYKTERTAQSEVREFAFQQAGEPVPVNWGEEGPTQLREPHAISPWLRYASLGEVSPGRSNQRH